VDLALEHEFREAAFAWLRARMLTTPVFTRDDLRAFEFRGVSAPLVHPQTGIWRPRGIETAVSIITTFSDSPSRQPYADGTGEDGLLRYKWQGDDGDSHDNVWLRQAMEAGLPLIWLLGVGRAPGRNAVVFHPQFPVFVVAEEPVEQQFVVALDLEQSELNSVPGRPIGEFERRYNEGIARSRLHQPMFRSAVLHAYESRCAICRLPFPVLLDAAHIKSDADGGPAHPSNGLALCKIHHGAFDASVLGIDPDYVIHIGRETLDTFDGPTLQHALKDMHHHRLAQLPDSSSDQPNRDFLAERFAKFQSSN
jgi:putative restriction endonuclease